MNILNIHITNNDTCPITESDLWAAPMDDGHKELVVSHYRRLSKIISKPGQLILDSYTHKKAARKQLAHMTLVIRDYMILHRVSVELGGSRDDTIETMVIDVVDAALFLQTTRALAFVSSQPKLAKEESPCLMLETNCVASKDGAETCGLAAKDLPDQKCSSNRTWEDLYPNQEWRRSRSEDNVLCRRRMFEIEDRARWDKDLCHRDRRALGWSWPSLAIDS